MNHHTAVWALFDERSSLERALEALNFNGFSYSDISVILPTDHETSDYKKSSAMLIGAGALPLPGLGALVAAGPIMAALGAAGAAGMEKEISKSLVELGLPENQACLYESLLREGRMLLSLNVYNQEAAMKAKDLLESCAASEITGTPETLNFFPSFPGAPALEGSFSQA